MPMEHFVKGLAAMLVDIVIKRSELSLLKIIALGALLSKDINIGTHYVLHTPVSVSSPSVFTVSITIIPLQTAYLLYLAKPSKAPQIAPRRAHIRPTSYTTTGLDDG